VLLAEDDPMHQQVALLLLRGVGLIPDLAETGNQAVRMAEANDYAAILMDTQMPEMSGLEACIAIRQMPARANTPILAMAANVFEQDRAKCLAAGMDDFIPKPADPDVLYAALLKWLDRSS